MATPQPTNRNLFIPKKGQGHPGYKTDMQTLEVWARQPIQQLVAGSGITLTPPSGLATDSEGTGPHSITIASTGAGTTLGYFELQAQSDDNQWSVGFFFPFMPSDTTFEGLSYYYFPSNSSGTFRRGSLGCSWFTEGNAGDSVNILPTIFCPAFTGGPLAITMWFWAANATFSNYRVYTGNHSGLTTGASYQMLSTDFTLATGAGADLSLVAGSGDTGNGIVTAAGGIPYWAGVSATLTIPTGTTF